MTSPPKRGTIAIGGIIKSTVTDESRRQLNLFLWHLDNSIISILFCINKTKTLDEMIRTRVHIKGCERLHSISTLDVKETDELLSRRWDTNLVDDPILCDTLDNSIIPIWSCRDKTKILDEMKHTKICVIGECVLHSFSIPYVDTLQRITRTCGRSSLCGWWLMEERGAAGKGLWPISSAGTCRDTGTWRQQPIVGRWWRVLACKVGGWAWASVRAGGN